MIKEKYHNFIQKWIDTEASLEYKELVLEFFRSFSATVRSNRKFVTQNADTLTNYKTTDKFVSKAVFSQRVDGKLKERYPTVEEMRDRLKINELKANLGQETVLYNDNIKNKQENEERKRDLTKGNMHLLKGIYPNTINSVYQATYKGNKDKYPLPAIGIKNVSAIKGIIPDKYTMSQLEEKTKVSDCLKKTVEHMMFGY